MKKCIYTIATLSLCTASSAFAALTLEDATYQDGSNVNTTKTKKVSGTGDVADFGETLTYQSLWLYGANIALNDSTKTLTLTSSNYTTGGLSVSNGSAYYSLVAQGGDNTITVSNGGNLSLIAQQNVFTVYDNSSTLTLRIEEDAGTVNIRKLAATRGVLTLNLYKENALASTMGNTPILTAAQNTASAGTITFKLNMTKNQNVTLDMRANSISEFLITDNSVLNVASIMSVINGTMTVFLSDGLVDGSIFFATSTFYDYESYDRITSTLKLTSGSTTGYYVFKDAEGNALTDLSWTNVDGGYLLTGIVPEPSTYAAIFGAFALAFAIARRRK